MGLAMPIITALVTALMAIGAAYPATADDGAVRLVADLDVVAKQVEARALAFSPVATESQVFFFADHPSLGRELWRSDGTTDGTYPVLDLCPGRCDSGLSCGGAMPGRGPGAPYQLLGAAGENIFLVAEKQLWTLDGAPDGARIVQEVPFERPSGAPAALGEVLFIPVTDLQGRMWMTNGSAEGTTALPLPVEVTAAYDPVRVGDHILFWAGHGQTNAYTLWRSDGTAASTQAVEAVCSSCRRPPRRGVAFGDRLLFSMGFTFDDESLWSIGVDGRARHLRNFAPYEMTGDLHVVDGRVYGRLQLGATSTLFVSDGTELGTRLAPELLPPAGVLTALHSTDQALYGTVQTTSGPRFSLWRLDGAAPVRLAEGSSIFVRPPADEALFFTVVDPSFTQISMVTFGTPGTTRPDPWSKSGAAPFGSGILTFSEETGEAWFRGHASVANPRRLELATSQADSAPVALTRWQDRLAFQTRSLGADSALTNLHIAASGPDSASVQLLSIDAPGMLHAFGDTLYRLDSEAELVEAYAAVDAGPGSPVGSLLLGIHNYPTGAAAVDDRVFIGGGDNQEIWGTRGTPMTTERLLMAQPGWQADRTCPGTPQAPERLTALGDDLLFFSQRTFFGSPRLMALDGTAPDGTVPGNRLVIELPLREPLGTAEVISEAETAGGLFYFSSFDQVWRSDGHDTAPLFDGELQLSQPHRLTAWQDRLLFVSREPGTFEQAPIFLWQVPAAGTPELMHTFPPETSILELVPSGDLLFLVVRTDDTGQELWVTDGSVDGLRPIDLMPGPRSSYARHLVAVPGGVFFAADDGLGGHEPWVSDGTPQGTGRVADLYPGPRGSVPGAATMVGDTVYFAADHPDTGRELFAVEVADLRFEPCPVDRLCLQGGRFEIAMTWHSVDDAGTARRAASTDESGLFYFFEPGNWESMVKVLDGCASSGRFWVLAASSTDLGYTLTVQDRDSGTQKVYHNPVGTAAPALVDVDAFATCP